jgi:hypothetical protein
MHTNFITDEQFHGDVLPALSNVDRDDKGFLSRWVGLHPRLGRVVAVQGGGSDMVLVSERAPIHLAGEAMEVAA